MTNSRSIINEKQRQAQTPGAYFTIINVSFGFEEANKKKNKKNCVGVMRSN